MNMGDLQFGDIILMEEKYYVYLAYTKDILYLAKILSQHDSKTMEDTIGAMLAAGQLNKSAIILAYITLTTDDFRGQMCMTDAQGRDSYMAMYITKTNFQLNSSDIKDLKKMILDGNTSKKLREEITKLDK